MDPPGAIAKAIEKMLNSLAVNPTNDANQASNFHVRMLHLSRTADDAEFCEVIDRWATLAEPVRLAVLALVRSAK